MKALAEQISELDGVVIYGRVVGVRGLVMERALHDVAGAYPAINVLQPVPASCRVRPIRPISQCSRERAGCLAIVPRLPARIAPCRLRGACHRAGDR